MFFKRKNIRAAFLCSFCGKGQDQVQRLIAGPGSVSVCNECIAQIAVSPIHVTELSCSFCGKTEKQVLSIYSVASPREVGICNECVSLCQEIITEHSGGV